MLFNGDKMDTLNKIKMVLEDIDRTGEDWIIDPDSISIKETIEDELKQAEISYHRKGSYIVVPNYIESFKFSALRKHLQNVTHGRFEEEWK